MKLQVSKMVEGFRIPLSFRNRFAERFLEEDGTCKVCKKTVETSEGKWVGVLGGDMSHCHRCNHKGVSWLGATIICEECAEDRNWTEGIILIIPLCAPCNSKVRGGRKETESDFDYRFEKGMYDAGVWIKMEEYTAWREEQLRSLGLW